MCFPAVALRHTKGPHHRRCICINYLSLHSYFIQTLPSKNRNINYIFIYLRSLRCLSTAVQYTTKVTTRIFKNIINLQKVEMVACVRESDWPRTARVHYLRIYTRWGYIFREHFSSCFFHWGADTWRPDKAGTSSRPGLAPKMARLLTADSASWLPSPTDRQGLKNSVVTYFSNPPCSSFQRHTDAVHVAYPLSLVYLKSQQYILFRNPQTKRSLKGQYETLPSPH